VAVRFGLTLSMSDRCAIFLKKEFRGTSAILLQEMYCVTTERILRLGRKIHQVVYKQCCWFKNYSWNSNRFLVCGKKVSSIAQLLSREFVMHCLKRSYDPSLVNVFVQQLIYLFIWSAIVRQVRKTYRFFLSFDTFKLYYYFSCVTKRSDVLQL